MQCGYGASPQCSSVVLLTNAQPPFMLRLKLSSLASGESSVSTIGSSGRTCAEGKLARAATGSRLLKVSVEWKTSLRSQSA
jgi:hypothetical protein